VRLLPRRGGAVFVCGGAISRARVGPCALLNRGGASSGLEGPFPRAAEAHASARAQGEGGGGYLQAVRGVCVGFG
jgi:hypothetical protein